MTKQQTRALWFLVPVLFIAILSLVFMARGNINGEFTCVLLTVPFLVGATFAAR